MDQEVLVAEQIDGGRLLIEELPNHGLEVSSSAWAKLGDDGRIYLYIASPFVSQNGWLRSYAVLDQALTALDGRWGSPSAAIDPFSVKMIEARDPLALQVGQILRSRADGGGSGMRDPRYPACRAGDHTAWGMYIYGQTLSAPQPA